MPPKGRRCRAPAAHVLCSPVKANTKICDTFKRRFVVEEEIAQGGFGRIYSAHQEDGTEYNKKGSLVVKVEPQANGPLFTEMHVFQRILQPQMLSDWAKSRKCKHLGLPPHLSSGIMKQGQTSLRYLIMPRYAESLEDMRNKNGGRLPADVVFTVAKHCCNSLSYMQEMCYAHGDVKAANILFPEVGAYDKCVLVDFGLARMAKSNVKEPDKKKAHNGTLLFTSTDAHVGLNPSYRGDLETLVFNVIFWLSGSLPWSDEQDPNKVFAMKKKLIENSKLDIPKLIGSTCSQYVDDLLSAAMNTAYEAEVDYRLLLPMLEKAASASRRRAKPSKLNDSISTPEEMAGTSLITKPARTSRKRILGPSENSKNPSNAPEGNECKTNNAGDATLSVLPKKKPKTKSKKASVLSSDATTKVSGDTKNTSDEGKESSQSAEFNIRNVIPGLANMGKIRRSLETKLIHKYGK